MHTWWSTRTRVLATALTVILLLAAFDASAGRKRRARSKADLKFALPGTVEVFSTTEGAMVEIDGRMVGTIPLNDELAVEPGQHTIRVHLRGWTEHSDSFVVKPGEAVELEIDLLPIAGIVRISTNETGATVKLNDRVTGVTPFDQDIPVGEVTVMISHPGFQDHVQSLDVQAGQSYDLNIQLVAIAPITPPAGENDGSIVRSWWFWTAIGVVVSGGVAAALVATAPADRQAGVIPGTPVLGVGYPPTGSSTTTRDR